MKRIEPIPQRLSLGSAAKRFWKRELKRGLRVRRAMPANIILVHDDLTFVGEVVDALKSAGHNVATFSDPIDAMEPINAIPRIDILISRVHFPSGRGNGVALAGWARMHRPEVKVLSRVAPENIDHVEEIAEFLVAPIQIPELVAAVTKLADQVDVTAPASAARHTY
jgi:DNA-binding NtrC family response regulator